MKPTNIRNIDVEYQILQLSTSHKRNSTSQPCRGRGVTGLSRLRVEVWAAPDGNISIWLRLCNVDDALFLQYEKCMELRGSVLARDLAWWNDGGKLGLSIAT